MTRTLLFHSGMPKTGTTSIQNACHAARGDLLALDRILYPGLAANHTNPVCTLFMDDPARHISNKMANIQTAEALTGLQAHYRAELVHELERDDWDTLVISAEGAANLSRGELGALRDWFGLYVDRIEVIYYLREPIGYTASVTQQLLKGGMVLADLYAKPELPNWKGRLANAIAVFGRDHVRIRDFGAGTKAEGGLVADFCDTLGFSTAAKAAVLAHEKRDNESLSMEAAEMLSALNTLRPMFGPEGRSARRTGRETLTFEQLPGQKFTLPLPVRRTVHERTRPDVAFVNETFGASLFDTPPPEGEDAPPAAGPGTPAFEATVLLVSDLLNANEALRACLQARHMADGKNLDGARSRLAYAEGLCPDDPVVTTEADRIRRRYRL